MQPNVLIVDDEESFREDLADLLGRRGFRCRTAGDIAAAGETARAIPSPSAILCDVVMPGGGALSLLRALSDAPDLGVFVMTAFGSLESAIDAFRAGAVDYLLKPLNLDEVERKLRRFFEHRDALAELRSLRHELFRVRDVARLVGKSRSMVAVQQLIRQVAPVRTNLLITGETGTGKEVTARMIHEASPWREERFIAVNCASLPETLLESQLFGHVRGAFTGAMRDQEGLFEAARGGTLLLDEVTEMSLAAQAKLLRVVERKEIVPLGSTEPRAVETRIIASTNRDLREWTKAGKFREDLFFRLSVVEVRLPPLRERTEDIPALVGHFFRRFNAELKRNLRGVDPAAMRALLAYPWPGNVRELENVIERATILGPGESIGLGDLPENIVGGTPRSVVTNDLRAALRVYEREHIGHILAEAGGNKEEAARRLGIDPATLYRKLSAAEAE